MLQVVEEVAEMAATHKERVGERAARCRLRKAGKMREPASEGVDEMRATASEMSELVIGKRQWWAALCGWTFHRKGTSARNKSPVVIGGRRPQKSTNTL